MWPVPKPPSTGLGWLGVGLGPHPELGREMGEEGVSGNKTL